MSEETNDGTSSMEVAAEGDGTQMEGNTEVDATQMEQCTDGAGSQVEETTDVNAAQTEGCAEGEEAPVEGDVAGITDEQLQAACGEIDEPIHDPKSTEEDGYYHAVFVMNIPLTATEDDVRNHFEQTVAVKNVSLVTGHDGKFLGYATVELPNIYAYKASLELIGTKMDSLYICVMPLTSLSQPGDTAENARIFRALVSNISKSINLNDAKKHFFPAGLIRRFVPKTVDGKNSKDEVFDEDWMMAIKVNKLETFVNILKMDGTLLGQQPIKVQPLVINSHGDYKTVAEVEPEYMKPDEEEEREANRLKLFVGNIPGTFKSQQVIDHFSTAGEVSGCWMPNEHGSKKRPKAALVIMADEEGYQKALELAGSKLEEHDLKILPYAKGKIKEGRTIADPKWLKKPLIIVVSNIPLAADEVELKKHFEDVGEAVCVRFPRKKLWKAAFLEMPDEDTFERAMTKSNTFLNGHCITVVPSSSKLVPKKWLGVPPKKKKKKKVLPDQPAGKKKKKKKGKGAGGEAGANFEPPPQPQQGGRKNKRKKGRRDDFDSYFPPNKKKKGNKKGGGMNFAAYDTYVTSYGYGGGYEPSGFTKPNAKLGGTKKKEIEQVALAALNELKARKSGMGNAHGSSSKNTFGPGSGGNFNYGSFGPHNYYY